MSYKQLSAYVRQGLEPKFQDVVAKDAASSCRVTASELLAGKLDDSNDQFKRFWEKHFKGHKDRPETYLEIQRQADWSSQVLMRLSIEVSKDRKLCPVEGKRPILNEGLFSDAKRRPRGGAYFVSSSRVYDCIRRLKTPQGKSCTWERTIRLLSDVHESLTPDGKTLKDALCDEDSFLSAVIVVADKRAAGRILKLLQRVEEVGAPPLFDRFLSSEKNKTQKSLSRPELREASREHLGHMKRAFGLDPSQRDALLHFLKTSEGETLAATGPPGTGKTASLQSIIATLVVKGALAGEPPFIIASGPTNQSSTNIISAFSGVAAPFEERRLESRWLDVLPYYGWYLPADSADEEKKASNQTILLREDALEYGHLAEQYLAYKENRAGVLRRIEKELLERFHEHFPERGDVTCAKDAAIAIFEALRDLTQETLPKALQAIDDYIGRMRDETKAGDRLSGKLQKMRAKGIRAMLAKLARVVTGGGLAAAGESEEERKPRPAPDLLRLQKSISTILEPFLDEGGRSTLDEALRIPDVDEQLSALEAVLDRGIRHRAFNLSMRYFECLWLSEALEGKTYRKGPRRRLHLERMLAPVIVSTPYTLPRLFALQGNPYSLGEADLLIIDEAGQMKIDLGAPLFSLAKRALVVGDVEQLPPIISFFGPVTERFVFDALRISSPERERIRDRGLSISEGNVMEASQSASAYSYEEGAGIVLLRHYRCHPDIIEFCNTLVYRKARPLIPMRRRSARGLFSAMAFADTYTAAQKAGSSWKNPGQAAWIVSFVKRFKEDIEEFYNERSDAERRTVSELVAIVTPYSAQKKVLRALVGEHLGEEVLERMTVGTVHALQGAEAPIVIFSSVSTWPVKGASLMDLGTNFLNVAVSRAQDSFIIVGDRRVFFSGDPKGANLPSRVLGEHAKGCAANIDPIGAIAVESPVKALSVQVAVGPSFSTHPTYGAFKNIRFAKPVDGLFVWATGQNTYGMKGHALKRAQHENQVTEDSLSNLARATQATEELIIATDDDRAGDGIGYMLLHELKAKIGRGELSRVTRMLFSDLRPETLRSALRDRKPWRGSRRAQAHIVQSIIDRAIGVHGGKLLDAKMPHLPSKEVSVGRVRSTILRHVSRKERERASTAKSEEWVVQTLFCPGDAGPGLGEVEEEKTEASTEEAPAPGMRKRLSAVLRYLGERFSRGQRPPKSPVDESVREENADQDDEGGEMTAPPRRNAVLGFLTQSDALDAPVITFPSEEQAKAYIEKLDAGDIGEVRLREGEFTLGAAPPVSTYEILFQACSPPYGLPSHEAMKALTDLYQGRTKEVQDLVGERDGQRKKKGE